MDTRTGETYATKDDALAAGVPEKYIAEVSGPATAVRRVKRIVMAAARVNAKRKAKRKMQAESRRRNRR